MKGKELFIKEYSAILEREMIKQGKTVRYIAERTGYTPQGIRQGLDGRGGVGSISAICRVLKVKMKKILKDKQALE